MKLLMQGNRWKLVLALLSCVTCPAEKIRLSTPAQPISAAVYVAAEKGYFKKEGLDVEVLELTTGKEGLSNLFSGKIEMAVAAETPLVHSSIAGDRFTILGTIGQSSRSLAFLGRK